MNGTKVERRRTWAIAIALAAAFAAGSPSLAQGRDDEVGRVAPEPFLALVGDEGVKVEVNIGPTMLGIVAAGVAESDPALRDTIRGLKGIKTLVLDLARTARPERADALVDDVVRNLERKGWERTARVRDETSNLNVLIRADGDDRARGLVVLILNREDRELVFVNLYGLVDLAQLQALSAEMEIPGLDRVPAQDPPEKK